MDNRRGGAPGRPEACRLIRSKISTKVKGQEMVKQFLERIGKGADSYVSVGVHEGAGSYPDGQSVVEVALWNEYGTRTVPERSFLRSTVDENIPLLNQWREEMIKKVLHEGWTVHKALEAIGFRIQVLIQNKIKSNVPPPNAPSTVDAKNAHGVAPNTLIDTGLLLRSITYQVHEQ
jgi:hypothetical protein